MKALAAALLILSAATARAAPSAQAPAIDPETGYAGGAPHDYDAPPPGSDADRALWQRAYDVNNQVLIERGAGPRLQLHARNFALEPRLSKLAKGDGPAAERGAALLAELEGRWREVTLVIGERWPIDPLRVCRYDLMNFESDLVAAAGVKQAAGAIDGSRESLLGCLARADAVLAKLAGANRGLERAIAAAEQALDEAGIPVPLARKLPVNAEAKR